MSRLAFAVMVKFASHIVDVENLIDEIDLLDSEMAEDTSKQERLLKYKEALAPSDNFICLFKLWASSSRMRLWITEKKKNLAEKIEKDITKDFLDEKKQKLDR